MSARDPSLHPLKRTFFSSFSLSLPVSHQLLRKFSGVPTHSVLSPKMLRLMWARVEWELLTSGSQHCLHLPSAATAKLPGFTSLQQPLLNSRAHTYHRSFAPWVKCGTPLLIIPDKTVEFSQQQWSWQLPRSWRKDQVWKTVHGRPTRPCSISYKTGGFSKILAIHDIFRNLDFIHYASLQLWISKEMEGDSLTYKMNCTWTNRGRNSTSTNSKFTNISIITT